MVVCLSQASRADILRIGLMEIDSTVPIVTIVLDCTTDKRHFHYCKESTKVVKADLQEHNPDEKVASNILEFAAELSGRRTKDMVPLDLIADQLAQLGARCHKAGKVLHCLLTGCNTCNLVLPICSKLDACGASEAKSSVWVLATRSVWPGDLSSFLWAEYGATVSTNLEAFRKATFTLVDDFTTHWRRQKIRDLSMEQQKIESLADLVLLDRLDNVEDVAGFVRMAPLLGGT